MGVGEYFLEALTILHLFCFVFATSKREIEQKPRNFNLNKSSAWFVRILVVGEVGAGKSSFINSVNNTFQGRITSGALVDGIGGTSFTKVVSILLFLFHHLQMLGVHFDFYLVTSNK